MSEFNLEEFLRYQDDGINEKFYATFSIPIGQLYPCERNNTQGRDYEVKHTSVRNSAA